MRKTEIFNFNSLGFSFNIFHSITLFAFATFILHSPAFSNPSQNLIQKLDNHYYYPQNEGLKKFTVEIHWDQMDLEKGSNHFLQNPKVKFKWLNNNPKDLRDFEILKAPFNYSSEREFEVVQLFYQFKELLFPRTLKQTLHHYISKTNRQKKNGILIRFISQNSEAPIESYDLMIDKGKWNVEKMQLKPKQGPSEVKSQFRYIEKEGKWLVSESISRYSYQKNKFKEKAEYYYKKIKGYWLPNKITLSLNKNGHPLSNYTFTFHNYQLN